MKNKKIGKILLCTTLALATPFALVGCGKKADNNTPDNSDEPNNQQGQQGQQQNSVVNVLNAKDYEGEYKDKSEVDLATAEEVKTILTEITNGHTVKSGEQNWNNWYEGVDNMIDDEDIKVDSCKKYTIAFDDATQANAAQTAYVALYANDNNWHDITALYNQYNASARGVYYTTLTDRDVVIGVEYTADADRMMVYTFSFTKNCVASAVEAAMNQNQNQNQNQNTQPIQLALGALAYDGVYTEYDGSFVYENADAVKNSLITDIVDEAIQYDLVDADDINDIPAAAINYGECKKYEITIPDNYTTEQQFAVLCATYAAKYEGTAWTDMGDYITGATGIYFKTDENKDILMSIVHHSTEHKIIIYVFSFAQGVMQGFTGQNA